MSVAVDPFGVFVSKVSLLRREEQKHCFSHSAEHPDSSALLALDCVFFFSYYNFFRSRMSLVLLPPRIGSFHYNGFSFSLGLVRAACLQVKCFFGYLLRRLCRIFEIATLFAFTLRSDFLTLTAFSLYLGIVTASELCEHKHG